MKKQKNILLLNPPGDKMYFRDYYCTKVSKAHYYYHPVDLVYLSGTLSKLMEVHLIDAIAEKLSPKDCIARIQKIDPQYVLFLISSPSYILDMKFLTALKKRLPDAVFIGTGDVYREMKGSAFKTHKFLDAILLDFSTEDILKYLKHGEGETVDNVIYRHEGKIVAGEEKHGHGKFEIATPRWDLFKLDKYKFPFERRLKFASILTDFGCPFKCSYCPVSTLGFKLREIDGVVKEVKLLRSLGVRELFFRDQTFAVNKKRTIELCKKLKNLDVGWTCFTRVDVLDAEVLKHMKRGGCHTIMFGIETSDEDLLKKYRKNTTTSQMENAITLCKNQGIETVGTFILGLPGETRESVLDTIRFAKKLNLDYASFNIATPRFGTTFRKEALEHDMVSDKHMVMESAKSKPLWKKQRISNEEIFKLHKHANRSFYMRPSYLLRRLFRIKTLHQLRNYFEEAYHLLFKN